MFEMGGVYISASRGASEIIQAFETIGIDVSNIHFIDLVSSGILGGTNVQYNNVSFVDSPIMLESILLRTLYWLRTAPNLRNFVFIDSVNSLAIYNEEKMLAEYLHTFINTFRQREVLSVILNIPDQVPPSVLSNLIYCQMTLSIGSSGHSLEERSINMDFSKDDLEFFGDVGSFGVPKFDNAMRGGVPRGFLVIGFTETGCGAELFGKQFTAPAEESENTKYISTNESRTEIARVFNNTLANGYFCQNYAVRNTIQRFLKKNYWQAVIVLRVSSYQIYNVLHKQGLLTIIPKIF